MKNLKIITRVIARLSERLFPISSAIFAIAFGSVPLVSISSPVSPARAAFRKARS